MKTFIELWPSLTWVFTFIIIALVPFASYTSNDKVSNILIGIQTFLLVIQLICFIIFLIFNKL